jgi:glycosyltransferase involved in cell wall biosynthesis
MIQASVKFRISSFKSRVPTRNPQSLNILFYAPFKPLGHRAPSGDLVIATGLYEFLSKQGHRLTIASNLRARWIYWKPWLLPRLLRERQRILRRLSARYFDLWLTYNTYYKGPDLLGPLAKRQRGLPYLIFQGVYSTKRRKKLRTLPGFYLNRRALCAADHVFTNKRVDQQNLRRILPAERMTYVSPGIYPEDFRFDAAAREALRRQWNVGNETVILSAAMFRPDVKTRGLAWVIRTCGHLNRLGRPFHLVIAGDGREKVGLQKLAAEHLPERVRFVGRIPRDQMARFYSAGDLFVFPGINESLGMVFMEAQSCGLPVVAFANAGIPEVVRDRSTGLLQPLLAFRPFVQAVDLLLNDRDLRTKMGQAARRYIRSHHDLNKNYRLVEEVLQRFFLR